MNIKNELAVGILFTVALLVLGYFTIMVRHEIFQPRDYYLINVKFDNVEGLEVGDDVKVNGVKAGVVDRIILEAESIDVQLKMFNVFRIFENYRVKIASQSALGGKFISIYPGTRVLHGKTYAEITDKSGLKGIAGDDPFAQIADLVSENRENIYQTIKNIELISGKLNSGNGTLGKLLNDSKVHDNATDLVKELRDTVEDAREQAPITSFIRAALAVF
jgi:phospholipid/cholesterol/gamma-HCH transport system substrate-binding protein